MSGSRCDSCHNGSYTSQGTRARKAKPSDHPKTTADCGCCHKHDELRRRWQGGSGNCDADANSDASENASTDAVGLVDADTDPYSREGGRDRDNPGGDVYRRTQDYYPASTRATGVPTAKQLHRPQPGDRMWRRATL